MIRRRRSVTRRRDSKAEHSNWGNPIRSAQRHGGGALKCHRIGTEPGFVQYGDDMAIASDDQGACALSAGYGRPDCDHAVKDDGEGAFAGTGESHSHIHFFLTDAQTVYGQVTVSR